MAPYARSASTTSRSRCHDLDETLDWYQRYFEFEMRGRRAGWPGSTSATSSSRSAREVLRRPTAAATWGWSVDDKEALRALLLEGGEEVSSGASLRVRDPSGNLLEIVDYRDVQFSKTPAVMRAMGIDGLAEERVGALGATREGDRRRIGGRRGP